MCEEWKVLNEEYSMLGVPVGCRLEGSTLLQELWYYILCCMFVITGEVRSWQKA